MKTEPKIISMGQIDLTEQKGFKAPDLAQLPVIATRNLVLFPGVHIPIALMREASRQVASEALRRRQTIGLCCQLDPNTDNPSTSQDVAQYGVFVDVLQIFDLPDGSQSAFLRATGKFKVLGDASTASIAGSPLNLAVSKVSDVGVRPTPEMALLAEMVMNDYEELASNIDGADRALATGIKGMKPDQDAPLIINTIATHLPVEPADKMVILAKHRLKERGELLLHFIHSELQKISLMRDIMERAREEITDEQRENFMRRQMDVMQRELYGDVDEIDKLVKRADETKLTEDARKSFDTVVSQMRRLSPSVPDYSLLYNYLTILLDLPWQKGSELNDSFAAAREALEAEHYGMDKVKERILEQLAVSIANPRGNAPILCLVGAPGVGKTSLGQSIAKALGRSYQRVSLGGVSDEAEIRGHRRTYIGAMPGRIIDAMRRAGSDNPVLLLDEIDKLSHSHHGDPASALLEVLDPEQNCKFHDNFIDVDFDLSKVMFIATANTLDTVPRPLLDRMEVVEVPGYLPQEKVEIARRHLVPRVRERLGEKLQGFEMSEEAINRVIDGYTSESGVRQLEKMISSIGRKLLVKLLNKADGSEEATNLKVSTAEQVTDLLGVERYSPTRYEAQKLPGVVTGLAWTAAGGEILFIESSLSNSKGEKLTLTGNLGDVMKESATIALQYVRSNADRLGIQAEMFENRTIHLHVPEGAVPKDGPSAGITMAVSLASTLTGRLVRPRLAMTGEITLRGKVLPVGGIKEKILAAKRAGITDIIICSENRRNILEIEPHYLEGLTFHYVDTVDRVFELALMPPE